MASEIMAYRPPRKDARPHDSEASELPQRSAPAQHDHPATHPKIERIPQAEATHPELQMRCQKPQMWCPNHRIDVKNYRWVVIGQHNLRSVGADFRDQTVAFVTSPL
ncbi:hypothetical protein GCM10009651_22330 [Microbacterium natoriense]